jgi:cytochrome o ubiquinol oxidase subunit 2
MTTVLHLMADHPGDFVGRSANYSGEGFAQMQFSVHALDEAGYEEWVAHAKQSPDMLTAGSYSELRAPGDAGPVHYYGMIHMTIDDILNSYMPSRSMHMHLEDSSSSTREAMPGMDMSGN